MKKLLLSTTVITFCAAAAHAGNLSEPVVEPVIAAPAPAPLSNWAGGYVGGNITWGQADVDAKGDFADLLASGGFGRTLFEPDGVGVALRAGYDWQFDKVVLGVGAEYNFGKIDGGGVGALAGAPFNAEISEAATLFGRIGYDVGDWLPYAVLGYTWADGEINTPIGSGNADLKGATVGLGVERKLGENWSMYGEYTYTDFGSVEDTDDLIEVDMSQIKLGLNYRF